MIPCLLVLVVIIQQLEILVTTLQQYIGTLALGGGVH